MKKSKSVSSCRKRRKENQVRVLGGKCQICGFDAYVDAQEFHHEDGKDKSFGISSGDTRSLLSYLDEIKKCYLLCANCHRGVHAGYLENPKDHIFLQDIADSLVESTPRKGRHKKNYCADCGKEICNTSTRCSECARQRQRAVAWPTKDELKELLRTYSFTEIGRMFGVNDNSVRKWCKRYDLPYRAKDIQAMSDSDWESV